MSVIVNVYNGARTLSATLASIMAQTFTDFEVIIWDDCSTDDSMELVGGLDDPRLRVYGGESNVGLGAARRAALARARAQWVGFVDQDDLWVETKLADQMNLVESMPDAGFVYGRTLRFFPDGRTEDYDHRHEFISLPRGNIFKDLFIDSCYIAISAVLFRRQVITSVPQIPDQISACPDYFLYLHIARRHPVNATDRVVCLYRMHDNNMTTKYGVRMQREILFLIKSWTNELDPALAARRRQVHSTVLAIMLIKEGQISEGLTTLFREGSVLYLASRPIARLLRKLRRLFSRPIAKQHSDQNVTQLLQEAVAGSE